MLTDLESDLGGTRFALMLADRDACIVDRRFSDPSLEADLDGIGAVLGNRFTEETTGTNSIATVFELRHGIAIRGPEHFLEPMKRFSCYGQPVRHPVTRRIEAVLQITGPAVEENALWAPIVNRAADAIAHRLLAGARADQQRMLVAFQDAAQRPGSIVVLLAEDIVMTSPAAQRTLEPTDHLYLRDLVHEARVEPRVSTAMLSAGRDTQIRFRRLAEAPRGVLFELTVAGRERPPVPRRGGRSWPNDPLSDLEAHRARRTRVLITGEAGSGRSTAASRLSGRAHLRSRDAADMALTGEGRWQDALADAARDHPGLLVVENIHLLSQTSAALTARTLRDSSVWFAFTSCPAEDLRPEHASLAALCGARVEIPPLRHRKTELPDLVGSLLDDLVPGSGRVHLTRGAWEALRDHSWPGNLHELREVLAETAERIIGDVLTAEDLPPWLRELRPTRRLSLLEQAERDAIRRTLQEHHGNKVHAAQALGISRTTLYKRIRLLDIEA
ncbi:MAG: sigma-54-dependent Fis family transcriptional regulator [Pseudonocardia sp.]